MAIDLKEILRKSVGMGASDIHLTVGTPPDVRINGA